eukprot:Nitzschia sp. Nitz4//scaffold15_size197535//49146//50929//NITZ4_001565-RA/size197535-augustus-gene-0.204-mRNA-1//1//CDS//3329537676//5365//frame0
MVKPRVASRMKAAVGGKKSHNESQDLVYLTEKYNIFCRRLQALIESLKQNYSAMQALAKSRQTVAMNLAELAKDSPLFDTTGGGSGEKAAEGLSSYLAIHESVSGKTRNYCSKYAQFVVDYAIEWEKVVTTRINRGLKTAEQYRVELDHYQSKVESLRQSANATMAKGKQVDQKSAEKLTRNEEKLNKIRQTHNQFVSSLCVLIDEVTDRSWRDLHPLLVKIAQFDVTLSGDEAKGMTTLNNVVNELKKLAVTHGIKPQARLKDLDSLDPSMLTTKAPESGGGLLALESGFGGSSPTSGGGFGPSLGDNQRLPPGTVSPQGMGGFPVAVTSSDSRSLSAAGSFDGSYKSGYAGSTAGAPSTLDMLAINASAAPPPTVDQLSAAFGPATTMTSSASLPPLGPSAGSSNYSNYGPGTAMRKQSFDSFDSGFSGASAPPPAAPPPPPPAQFGTAQAANSNPFGPGPVASAPSSYGAMVPSPSASSYGAPNPFGAGPTTPSYSTSNPAPNPFGSSPPAPGPGPNYGMPPPLPPSYGQPQPYGQQNQYGQPPRGSNPFE